MRNDAFGHAPNGATENKTKSQAPRSIGFKLVDALYILMTVMPFVLGMALKVLTTPPSDGINVTGALIYFTIPLPVQALTITESQVNSWLVMISIAGLCLYLTHGIRSGVKCKRHLIASWIVEKTDALVGSNMGDFFAGYSPFVGAILGLSAFSSLSSLLGLYPPTSDVNVVFGWSLLVFIIITYYKLKGGVWNYIRGFGDPLPIFAPFNVIGELSTPVSMAFRHYGNVLSGVVVSTLVASALQGLSSLVFGGLPGALGNIPFLRIGLPAILSIYFDLFSGCLQAFIFAMLTMLYISNGFPMDLWMERMKKREARKAARDAKRRNAI